MSTASVAFRAAAAAVQAAPVDADRRTPDAQEDALVEATPTAELARAVATIADWTVRFIATDMTFAEALDVVDGLDGLPPDIEHAIRIVRHAAVQTLAPDSRRWCARTALTDWFDSLDPQESHVLLRRTLARSPRTLRSLATDLDCSAERVRTIESQLLAHAALLFRPSWLPLAQALAEMRARSSPVARVRVLDDIDLGLSAAIPGLEVSDAECLARLSREATVDDGLIGWPSAAAWAARIETEIAGIADSGDEQGLDRFKAFLSSHLIDANDGPDWIDRAGFTIRGTAIVPRARTLADQAHRALLANDVMSTDEIAQALGVRRSSTSLRRALNHDARLVQVGPKHWAAVERGRREYASLTACIADALDRADGPLRFDQLVERISADFVVSAASVRVMVGRPPFATAAGEIRRA